MNTKNKNINIGWFDGHGIYGATAYNKMAQEILSRHYNLETINIQSDGGIIGYLKVLFYIYKIDKKLNREKDILIRGFHAIIGMWHKYKKMKDIAIIHHMPLRLKHRRGIGLLLEKIYEHNLRKADAIITVSKYWQNYFISKGYSNVHVIYNAFNLSQSAMSESEIANFKKKFNLCDKPIIYLGNCRKEKGVVEAYDQLKDMNVYLITSGKREVDIPVTNLDLSYREYLCLLRSSAVVITMSKYREGWNRTAHEAMLCKRPVIGSGLGGMHELLEGGEQIICDNFSKLRKNVNYILENPEFGNQLGNKGYEFAKNFTSEKFEKQWIDLIGGLKNESEERPI